jgi:hypothetical protein
MNAAYCKYVSPPQPYLHPSNISQVASNNRHRRRLPNPYLDHIMHSPMLLLRNVLLLQLFLIPEMLRLLWRQL